MRKNSDLIALFYEDVQMVALGSSPLNSANFELRRDCGLCTNVYDWARSMGMTSDVAYELQAFQCELFTAMNLDEDFPFNDSHDYMNIDDHYADTKANAARYAWIDGGWRESLTPLEAHYG